MRIESKTASCGSVFDLNQTALLTHRPCRIGNQQKVNAALGNKCAKSPKWCLRDCKRLTFIALLLCSSAQTGIAVDGKLVPVNGTSFVNFNSARYAPLFIRHADGVSGSSIENIVANCGPIKDPKNKDGIDHLQVGNDGCVLIEQGARHARILLARVSFVGKKCFLLARMLPSDLHMLVYPSFQICQQILCEKVKFAGGDAYDFGGAISYICKPHFTAKCHPIIINCRIAVNVDGKFYPWPIFNNDGFLGSLSRPSSGPSSPSSKAKRNNNDEETGGSKYGLTTRPPDGIFSGFRHPSLLAQIVIFASLGAVTAEFIIIGFGFLLGLLSNWQRQWIGLLLLLGLFCWGGDPPLSFSSTRS